MKKILFLTGQVSHIMDCISILNHLPKDISYKFICMDAYYYNNTESYIKSKSLPYIMVEAYGTRNTKQILLFEDPSLIISFYDTTSIPRLFIKNARSLGIPTLLIQEGNILPYEAYAESRKIDIYIKNIKNILFGMREYTIIERLTLLLEVALFKIKNIDYGWGSAGCSRIAVSGIYYKDLLISRKLNPNKIVITGQPRFDRLYATEMKKANSGEGPVILLWTTLPAVETGYCSEGEWNKRMSMVVDAIDNLPYYELFIKLHPREKIEKYKDLAGRPHIHIYLDSLDDLLKNCDILLTSISTTAIEAAILKKPVVILKFMDDLFPYSNPYVAMDAFMPVGNIEELLSAIRRLLHDRDTIKQMSEAREKFLYQYTYLQDGNSSQRMANLIIELMNRIT